MEDHATVTWSALPALSDAERVERSHAFYEKIRTRRTCRMFAPDPVPREVIENAILAAGTAPSGANHQPWHFAVIGSPEVKAQIRAEAEAEERDFYNVKASPEWLAALAPLGTDAVKPYLETAPWLIVVFAQRRGGIRAEHDKQNYYIVESAGIAAGLLLAALHDAGLATLVHTPNPLRLLHQVCRRPGTEKPLMIVVVGKPALDATVPVHATIKTPLDQISSWL